MTAQPTALRGARRLGTWTRFFLYGLLGWCVECFFTSLMDFASGAGDLRLMGYSYLWMHPIWGAGILASERLCPALRRAGLGRFTRALVYMVLCFAVEYASGAVLQALTGRCPWDYSASVWSVHGFIRLDYAPFWALCGYLGEPLCSLMRRVRLSPPERLPSRSPSRPRRSSARAAAAAAGMATAGVATAGVAVAAVATAGVAPPQPAPASVVPAGAADAGAASVVTAGVATATVRA